MLPYSERSKYITTGCPSKNQTQTLNQIFKTNIRLLLGESLLIVHFSLKTLIDSFFLI